MDQTAREALMAQIQEDMRTFEQNQEREWAANRAALRRFLGG